MRRTNHNGSFFLQAKVRYDFPTATLLYGGLKLDKALSIETELMHGEPTASAMGIGVGYQFFREMGEHQQGEIAFMPVYFRVQGTLVHANKFSLYFGFRIGYNAVFLDGEYQDVYNIEGGKSGLCWDVSCETRYLWKGVSPV